MIMTKRRALLETEWTIPDKSFLKAILRSFLKYRQLTVKIDIFIRYFTYFNSYF